MEFVRTIIILPAINVINAGIQFIEVVCVNINSIKSDIYIVHSRNLKKENNKTANYAFLKNTLTKETPI